MIERATAAVLCWPVPLLRKTFIAGMLLSTIAMIVTASAQSDYPNRPVQLIVPYGAGGIADVGMRIVADQLTSRLKQQFVVENRPGAGGIVVAKAAASAAPDGYTVLMSGNKTPSARPFSSHYLTTLLRTSPRLRLLPSSTF
jgi:tripartite-type tricarboxylate transporter receptor subunit TctC